MPSECSSKHAGAVKSCKKCLPLWNAGVIEAARLMVECRCANWSVRKEMAQNAGEGPSAYAEEKF